ncbi:MAG: hypothetical protein RBT63_03730 [Bdellovibrionales bacterium]|nr:hypothetical protein [Bdellovibrionales bacterium]
MTQKCYCAYCGSSRKVYTKAHVSFLDVVLAVFIGVCFMVPLAGGFDPRGIAIGAVFVGVAEIFTVLRHRMSMKCGRCGFDPVVYRRSREDAARLVREHLARRANDPATLLAEPVVPAGVRAKREREKRQFLEEAGMDSPQQM